MSYKATKGDWFAVNYGGSFVLQTTPKHQPNDDLLMLDDHSNAEANAKLAAAAPRLLRTLEGVYVLLKHLHQTGTIQAPDTIRSLWDAIDNAK